MFEVKPMSVEKNNSSTGPNEDSKEHRARPTGFEALGTGCESLYLYDSQNWVGSPSGSPDETSAISPVLAEETLRYMTFLALEHSSFPQPGSHSLSQVLSSDRVEQMAKTYSDIDMVTHLLAERDRDLELAARIGQSLLQRNHMLQERSEATEEQLAHALDQVLQLQHELGKKEELLRMVASASEESETDSSCSTPLRQGHALSAQLSLSQLEALQSKLQGLEEENLVLRSQACLLKTETITYEEKEQQLVSDCVKELRESNSQMATLTDELSQKNEELLRHQEEIAQLLSQIVELQHRVKELALEKEELRIHLQASKEAQRQLTAELNELQDRNAECVGMLQESQEEIRELRHKNTPSAGGMRRHLPYAPYPMDSLAAEIEGTMRRELSVDEESAVQDQRVSQKRVFQTVRSINQSVRAHPAAPPIPGSARSSVVMTAQPFQSGVPPAQTHSHDGATQNSREEARLGQPGSPGGSDLVSALHRLSLRRQNFLCERQFFQAERKRKLQVLAGEEPEGTEDGDPASGLSSLSGSVISDFSVSSSCYKTFLPEKLQIVKPMEGSLTLHHWQQLAQPHLATILDPHPGVVTKGFRPLPQDAVYRLNDLEEDEDEEEGEDTGRYSWERLREDKEKMMTEEDEEDEEAGGITFQVQCSSTPEVTRERRPVLSTVNARPPSPPSQRDMPPTPLAPPTSDASAPAAVFLPKNQILSTPASSSAHNPGKCLSSTSSTYTFTTCRILHPCDVTQVTQSSLGSPAMSVSENMPSSLRTGPSTPVTPCRLQLSLGDSIPPRRSTGPRGLAKLLVEKGISAQVSVQPAARLRPVTPPNSPHHSRPSSPAPVEPHATAPSDNFLASRPAELFLQDVYGLRPGRARPDPTAPLPLGPRQNRSSVNLVERVRRLGFAKVLQQAGEMDGLSRPDSATFLPTGGGSLLDGLRRNQSLPAMIGARASSACSQLHSHPAPLPHPTSLALPITTWGSLKEPNAKPSSCSPPPDKP